MRSFQQLSLDRYRQDHKLNLMGALRVHQRTDPLLRNASEPSDVGLFSIVAGPVGFPGHASMASAKPTVEERDMSFSAQQAPSARGNVNEPSITQTALAEHLLNGNRKCERYE